METIENLKLGEFVEVKDNEGGTGVVITDGSRYLWYLSDNASYNGAKPDKNKIHVYKIYKQFLDKYMFSYSFLYNTDIVQRYGFTIISESVQKVEIPEGTFPSIMNDNYECTTKYFGIHEYHHSRSISSYLNKPKSMKEGEHRIGVEIEMVAKGLDDYTDLVSTESNIVFFEKDSSLPDYGIEAITIPLLPKDAKSVSFWEKITKSFSKKAYSWKDDRCGLHVHIGREILGADAEKASETIGKLLYFYTYQVKDAESDLNSKIYGRSIGYRCPEVKGSCVKANAVSIVGNSVLKNKDIVKDVDDEVKRVMGATRYFDINIRNANTIEFRKGKGTLNASRIVSVITYCELMIEFCKRTRWTDLSNQRFEDFIKSKLPSSSPLWRWFPQDELDN